ncbi:hypothetical protein LSPH24S_09554 [Lysinibacillus sphaericus]
MDYKINQGKCISQDFEAQYSVTTEYVEKTFRTTDR